MEDLKSIKINLRGLFITSNSEVTIDTLNEDYKEMMGKNIPFVKHGFETLESFLCSLTDTFLINGSNIKLAVQPNNDSTHGVVLVEDRLFTKKTRKTFNNSHSRVVHNKQNVFHHPR